MPRSHPSEGTGYRNGWVCSTLQNHMDNLVTLHPPPIRTSLRGSCGAGNKNTNENKRAAWWVMGQLPSSFSTTATQRTWRLIKTGHSPVNRRNGTHPKQPTLDYSLSKKTRAKRKSKKTKRGKKEGKKVKRAKRGKRRKIKKTVIDDGDERRRWLKLKSKTKRRTKSQADSNQEGSS